MLAWALCEPAGGTTTLLYQFGEFGMDTRRRELRQRGELVSVEPQVFDLLEFLVRTRDRVVSRDDLLAAVWHGRNVSDATLSSRVNSARAAIGDNGKDQRLIRTLPRKGVRFVGVVQEVPDPSPEVPVEAMLESAQARMADPNGPSIAVLPFTNMGGDPEQDYFSDGIAEDIITALSRVSRLFVIARNSSFIYKGKAVDVRRVARELGVGYVLEGSVRRSGTRLRISGQLVDAASGVHLWAERYDGDWSDVFELQDRITERVVAAIEPTLQSAEIERHKRSRPNKLDAYDLLLRAYGLEYEFTAESMTAALDCLTQALAVDPTYAPAMAAAAYVHAQRHFQGWAPYGDAYRTEGVALAWRAIELAPNDAQVLWMAAFAVWNLAGESREAACELFARSVILNPNSAMALALGGWIETMRGNQPRGREMIERALLLNPRDPRGWFMSRAVAIAAIIGKDYPKAISWAEKALVQNRRFAVALRVLAVALVKVGQHDRAAQIVQDLLKVEPGLTISEFLTRIPVPLVSMATTYAEALRAAGLPE